MKSTFFDKFNELCITSNETQIIENIERRQFETICPGLFIFRTYVHFRRVRFQCSRLARKNVCLGQVSVCVAHATQSFPLFVVARVTHASDPWARGPKHAAFSSNLRGTPAGRKWRVRDNASRDITFVSISLASYISRRYILWPKEGRGARSPIDVA